MKIKISNDMPDVCNPRLRKSPWRVPADPSDQPGQRLDPAIRQLQPMTQGKPIISAPEKTGQDLMQISSKVWVEVPLTWTDFMAACETIKTQSEGQVVCVHMGGADSWPVGQYYDFFSTALAISPTPNDEQALLDGTYDWSKYTVLSQNLLDLKTNGYLNEDALNSSSILMHGAGRRQGSVWILRSLYL
jgi:raffinose/stachyose/melibiose transport system substrate-binding protein